MNEIIGSGEFAHIFIGKQGRGKTTLTKQLLDDRPEGMPVVIYDINNEYTEYYTEPFIDDFDEFLDSVKDLENHYIVIEEATIFFDTSSRFKQMKKLLVRIRHTHNIVQLNFHSWLSVPKNIYNLIKYVTIFKTNDSFMTVKAKYDYPMILEAYEESRLSNDEFFCKTIQLK